MRDIIGKRRWFYAFSLLLTIPGLFFILLSPISDAGLQLTIDYTGGTTWQIRFADPNVSADAVATVFRANGLQAIVVTGYADQIVRREAVHLQAEHLEKPVDADRLLQVVGNALSRRSSPTKAG